MTKKLMTGKQCVGDVRLMPIDVGFDMRAVGMKVRLPDQFSSVGLVDRHGKAYLIEGTHDEMIDFIKECGYELEV